MLSIKLLAAFVCLLSIFHSATSFATKGHGSCPPQLSVRTCFPRCLSDFECMGYKRCCRNYCGTMSCSDTSPVYSGNEPSDNKPSGVMCGNVKCLPGQKCISDGSMKRPRCS